MNIGYARVSTDEQNLDSQRDTLEKADCELIFTDQVSGTKARRPGLDDALSHLRKGDTLVVQEHHLGTRDDEYYYALIASLPA